jgi:TetR/AcrR family transcriptional regulator
MPRPPQNLPADERRARTVEALLALAAETNPDRITTAAIAAHMGVTQGALFRHFADKAAIWEAAMQWVGRTLPARIEHAIAGQPSTLAALEAAFLTHAAFVVEHPGVPRILFGELQRPEESAAKVAARALLGRYAERLAALIAQGQARGELAPEIDPAAAAGLFIGAIQGLVVQSLLAGDVGRVAQAAPGAFALFRRAVAVLP